MSVLVKAAAGLGAAATVATGGYFLFAGGSIEVFVISEQGSVDSAIYGTNTFGNAYADYMADPGEEKNKPFWEESFKKWQNDKNVKKIQFGKKFENVGFAYKGDQETNNNTALNQICKAAFKESKENVASNVDDTDTTKFKESEVWKYCSASRTGSKPVLLKDSQVKEDADLIAATESPETWGKKSKEHLVSTKDTSNDWFWELREKKFRSEQDSTEASEKNIFKTRKKSGNTVKQTCQLAYVKDSGSSADVTDADLKKYCYFEKTTQ
ncbi:hypothetical protein [Candidatus Mycoplasma haematohominis]|uniref:hypothetical protein n=1 Tax=Candidatus Mycoplasma haematohominis TaxID=1494318 RepID=UPI001C0A688F|nr:hypothetical protein [Candidatus Mycoplasma haemohominis]